VYFRIKAYHCKVSTTDLEVTFVKDIRMSMNRFMGKTLSYVNIARA